MADGPRDGAAAARASRAGTDGRSGAQGARPATRADPLVERQGPGGTTRDSTPRPAHAGERYRPLARPGQHRQGSTPEAATRVPGPPAATRVPPAIQRAATSSGSPDQARPSQARVVSARSGPQCRHPCRPTRVWVAEGTAWGGRPGARRDGARAEHETARDTGRGPPIRLGHPPPPRVAEPCPDGPNPPHHRAASRRPGPIRPLSDRRWNAPRRSRQPGPGS